MPRTDPRPANSRHRRQPPLIQKRHHGTRSCSIESVWMRRPSLRLHSAGAETTPRAAPCPPLTCLRALHGASGAVKPGALVRFEPGRRTHSATGRTVRVWGLFPGMPPITALAPSRTSRETRLPSGVFRLFGRRSVACARLPRRLRAVRRNARCSVERRRRASAHDGWQFVRALGTHLALSPSGDPAIAKLAAPRYTTARSSGPE
jgi:hypothetical protein